MGSKPSALAARALVVAAALAAGGAFAGCSEADRAAAAPTPDPVTNTRSATEPRTTIGGAAIRDQATHAAANDAHSN